MQAEAAAAALAGGRGRLAQQPSLVVDQRPHHARVHRAAAEEAHQHRDHSPAGLGEGLPAEPEAHLRGDCHACRVAHHGEGGGEGLVLQPPPEGEADQPSDRLLHVPAYHSARNCSYGALSAPITRHRHRPFHHLQHPPAACFHAHRQRSTSHHPIPGGAIQGVRHRIAAPQDHRRVERSSSWLGKTVPKTNTSFFISLL